jgi:hypothetical protein
MASCVPPLIARIDLRCQRLDVSQSDVGDVVLVDDREGRRPTDLPLDGPSVEIKAVGGKIL